MAFRSSSSNGSTSPTVPTVPVPSGVAANDIIIVVVSSDGSTLPTGLTGFTTLDTTGGFGGDGQEGGIYWKRATGPDTGTYAFTSWASGSGPWQMQAYCFSGRDTGNPPVNSTQKISTTTTGTTGTCATNAVTAVLGDDLLWLGVIDYSGTPTGGVTGQTPPSGYTAGLTTTGTASGAGAAIGAYNQNVAAGSTSASGTYTLGTSAGNTNVGWLVRIPSGLSAAAPAGTPLLPQWFAGLAIQPALVSAVRNALVKPLPSVVAAVAATITPTASSVGAASATITAAALLSPTSSSVSAATATITTAVTPTVIQSSSANGGSSFIASLSTTLPSNVTAGDVIVVATGGTNAFSIGVVTDSLGTVYRRVVFDVSSGLSYITALWYGHVETSGPCTVTYGNFGGSGGSVQFVRIAAAEVKGINWVDQVPTPAHGTGTSLASSSVTTGFANEYEAAWMVSATPPVTPGSGWTSRETPGTELLEDATPVLAAGSSVTATATASSAGGTDGWVSLLATFYESAGPHFVQSASLMSATVATFSLPVEKGDLIVVAFGWIGGGSSGTVADTLGTPYTLTEIMYTNPSLGYPMGIAYGVAPTSGTCTVTITPSVGGSSFQRILIAEYWGVNTLDQHGHTDGTGTAMAGSSFTTNFDHEVLFAWCVNNSNYISPGTGWTTREIAGSEGIEDQVDVSAGTYQATATGGNDHWTIEHASFYLAPTLPASANSVSAATATITAGAAGAALSPTAASVSATTVAMTVGMLLSPTASSVSAATATITTQAPLAPTASSVSAATATITATGGASLSPSANSVGAASATITAPALLSPSSASISAATASITAAPQIVPSAASISAATAIITAIAGPALSPIARSISAATATIRTPVVLVPVARSASAAHAGMTGGTPSAAPPIYIPTSLGVVGYATSLGLVAYGTTLRVVGADKTLTLLAPTTTLTVITRPTSLTVARPNTT